MRWALVVGAAVLLPAGVSATTWKVEEGESIQAAIDSAQYGDDVLVYPDGAVHFPTTPVQAAERKMSLDGVAVEFCRTEESLERLVGLLVDEEIHAG